MDHKYHVNLKTIKSNEILSLTPYYTQICHCSVNTFLILNF